jgi:hypothetical protein
MTLSFIAGSVGSALDIAIMSVSLRAIGKVAGLMVEGFSLLRKTTLRMVFSIRKTLSTSFVVDGEAIGLLVL